MALKALIFDLDGTVIQSQNILKMALYKYFTEEQFKRLMQEYHYLKGLNESQLIPVIKEIIAVNHISEEQMREDLLNLCIENKKKLGIDYVVGFKDFHTSFAAHQLDYCIATNGRGQSLAETLKLVGIEHIFGQKIYTPDHVLGRTKPDPAVFLYALEQLECDPSEAIIFEDSHPGVAAAHAAGVACIGINTSGGLDLEKDNLLFCVDDYRNLTLENIVKEFLKR